jgi:predicted metal-dependent phosphoesterase TrpH
MQLAKEIGLSGLSITDHDTIEAYNSLFDLGKEFGLEVISGVEFSSYCEGKSVHVLGYNFDVKNKPLLAFCQSHQNRRKERNLGMLKKLEAIGKPVTEDEILALNDKSTGRPHIALAMIKRGYVSSVQEAFNLYLGDQKSCFVQGNVFSVEETIDIIHAAGGIAIIAHPHLITPSSLLHQVLKLPFDGIECWYSRFPPQQEARWIDIANRRGWIKTGGSDYHGSVKPQTPLGCSWVNREHFDIIRGANQG